MNDSIRYLKYNRGSLPFVRNPDTQSWVCKSDPALVIDRMGVRGWEASYEFADALFEGARCTGLQAALDALAAKLTSLRDVLLALDPPLHVEPAAITNPVSTALAPYRSKRVAQVTSKCGRCHARVVVNPKRPRGAESTPSV